MLKQIGMLALFATLLSGCSSGGPQFLRGNYYMTGDSNCKYSRARTANSINCYDSDDKLTGYRNAMTDQQLQMYRYEKQQALDSFNRGLDSFGESMDSISRNTPKTTYTDCYNTFGNGVSCTSSTY